MSRIAVIGAGAVGLSTAVQIQELQVRSGVEVTVIADRFTVETTSHGVPGIFRPTLSKTPGVPLPLLKTWLGDSWLHYDEIVNSADSGIAGVQVISGYQFVNKPDLNELERDVVYQYRPLSKVELNMFPGRRFRYGWFVTTMTVESSKYLPYLLERFKKNGGLVADSKTITSLEELVGKYDVIVNCTGMGSHRLVGDVKLVPNRGHLIKLRAPWVKHFVYTGDEGLSYIIPGIDVVTVGGTRTDNDTDLAPRAVDRDRIMADACRVVPSLANAEIVSEWVGLRPHREPVRVEAETMHFRSGSLQVVHNYGHGAEGITLSWGTAKHATKLVLQILNTPKSLPPAKL